MFAPAFSGADRRRAEQAHAVAEEMAAVSRAADEGPLREDSVALCSQIRTVSIDQRIVETLGPVPDERMDEVDRPLEYSLGLVGLG